MRTTITRARNAVFALAMAGTLAYGANTALAAPAQAKKDACSPGACDRQCKAQFGSFAGGFCEMGVCNCAV